MFKSISRKKSHSSGVSVDTPNTDSRWLAPTDAEAFSQELLQYILRKYPEDDELQPQTIETVGQQSA
jgi:hypothetical protein